MLNNTTEQNTIRSFPYYIVKDILLDAFLNSIVKCINPGGSKWLKHATIHFYDDGKYHIVNFTHTPAFGKLGELTNSLYVYSEDMLLNPAAQFLHPGRVVLSADDYARLLEKYQFEHYEIKNKNILKLISNINYKALINQTFIIETPVNLVNA